VKKNGVSIRSYNHVKPSGDREDRPNKGRRQPKEDATEDRPTTLEAQKGGKGGGPQQVKKPVSVIVSKE